MQSSCSVRDQEKERPDHPQTRYRDRSTSRTAIPACSKASVFAQPACKFTSDSLSVLKKACSFGSFIYRCRCFLGSSKNGLLS